MNAANEHRDREPELEAPRGLIEDVAALYRADVPVPPEVDEAVVSMARQRFAPRRRPRLVLRWAFAGAAASAAALLLALWIVGTPERRSRAPVASAHVSRKEDFDGDGRVDILDAFALARHLESAHKPKDKWDMNGDGIVDRADVDRIAMAAVSLKRGT